MERKTWDLVGFFSSSTCSFAFAGRSVLRDSRSSLTPALRRSTRPTDLPFFPFPLFSSGIAVLPFVGGLTVPCFTSLSGWGKPRPYNSCAWLHRQKRSRIAEVARLPLRPLIEPGSIHNDLAVGSQFHVRAIHGPRRGTFEVHTLAVVAAAVARALELVLAGFPIGCAAQMRAASVNDEHTARRAVHPDAVLLLPLGIDAQSVVRSVANLENRRRFKERAGKEKFKEGDEPRAEKSCDGDPYQPPPLLIDFAGLGTDSRQTASRRCFGRTDGRRTDVSGCISTTGSGRLRRFRFWFGRISFRARHAIPPGSRKLPAAHESAAPSPLCYRPNRELHASENGLIPSYSLLQREF